MSLRNTLAVSLTTVLLIAACADLNGREVALARNLMATSFGGNAVPTQTCCLTANKCTSVTPQGCSQKNNTSTAICTGFTQLVYQKQYAKFCQTPNPQNPKADCTTYTEDSNGKQYRCVAATTCAYDKLTGACSSTGNENVNQSVFGYYSCACNCP